jgi:hypothetical protein
MCLGALLLLLVVGLGIEWLIVYRSRRNTRPEADRRIGLTKAQRRCLVYIAIYVAGFGAMVFDDGAGTSLRAAVVVGAPLWIPAIIPSRLVLISRIVRWVCALEVLFYFPLWAAVLAGSFGRVVAGSIPAILGLAFGTGGFVGCIIAVIILVSPEIRRFMRRSPSGSVQPTAAGPAAGGA